MSGSWPPQAAGSLFFQVEPTMRKRRALIFALLLAGIIGCGSPTGQGINRDKDKPVPASSAKDTRQAP
jgi:hypothetical protein